ncbi:hypothetical protein R6874_18920, partial [Mycobacterium tuberculosis]
DERVSGLTGAVHDDLLAELKKKPGIHAVHMAGGNKAEIAPTISESG